MDSAWGELRERREENATLRGELAVIQALIHERSEGSDGGGVLSAGSPVLSDIQAPEPSFWAPSFQAPSELSSGVAAPTRQAQLSLNIFHMQFQLDGILEELGNENEAAQALRGAIDTDHLLLLAGGRAFVEPRPRYVQSLIDEVLKRYGVCCCR